MMSKLVLVVLTLFVAQIHSLSYNWPANPTQTPILKPHVTALFGPQSYQDVTGPVLVANPTNFCDVPQGMVAVGILMVERGNCTFYQKAQNALRVGATGIVIANTIASVIASDQPDYPLRMGYPTTENPSAITIPVVSITARDFVEIEKKLLQSNDTLTITLTQAAGTGGGSHPGGEVPPPPPPPNGDDHHGNDNDEPTPAIDSHNMGHRSRRSHLMNGFIIAAIVASSCLCGFCCGRRCGARRSWCRRQQAQAAIAQGVPVAVEASAPPQSIVHGGERYVQVDMQAPVAYYGEQEMAPVPSAPPVYLAGVAPTYSSVPSSAPSNYA